MNLKKADGSWTAIGIVSFGPAGCAHGIPSIFTRIQSYLDWIDAVKNGTNWITTTTLPPVPAQNPIGTITLTNRTEISFKSNANSLIVSVIMIVIVCFSVSVLLH